MVWNHLKILIQQNFQVAPPLILTFSTKGVHRSNLALLSASSPFLLSHLTIMVSVPHRPQPHKWDMIYVWHLLLANAKYTLFTFNLWRMWNLIECGMRSTGQIHSENITSWLPITQNFNRLLIIQTIIDQLTENPVNFHSSMSFT